MSDFWGILKSFIKNLLFSFPSCLVSYFLIKMIAGWYRDELTTTAGLLLLLFVPVGFAAFATSGDGFASKLIRIAGLLLILIPTLLHHLDMLDINATYVRVEAVILPISWIASAMTYIQIGYDIWGDWAKFSLAYVFVLFNIINIMFSGRWVLYMYLIAGCIALLYLGYIRIKEGSAFEY